MNLNTKYKRVILHYLLYTIVKQNPPSTAPPLPSRPHIFKENLLKHLPNDRMPSFKRIRIHFTKITIKLITKTMKTTLFPRVSKRCKERIWH